MSLVRQGLWRLIRVKRKYADDEANTETATILQMFLGGPGAPTPSGRAIHWHADPTSALSSSTRTPSARRFHS